MARVAIPIAILDVVSVDLPAAIASHADDDHVLPWNDGRVLLEVTNITPAAVIVTVRTSVTVIGRLNLDDVEITVPAGQTWYAGPFAPRVYNEPDDSVLVDVNNFGVLLRGVRV